MRARPAFEIPPGLRDMMLASLLFALMVTLVKEVERTLPVAYAVFARSVISLVLSFLAVRRARLSWLGQRRSLLVTRGLLGFAALMCTFEAIARVPLSDVVILFQTQPIWTALLAMVFLREPTRPRIWLATLVALTGVVLVVRPTVLFGDGGPTALDPVGVVLALAAAVVSGGAYVSVRALGKSDEPIIVVLWFALIATPASLPALLSDLRPVGAYELVLLLGIGATVQGAQILMTRAMRSEPAGRVAAVGYMQVVYAIVIGLLVFGETLSPLVAAGGVLVLAGALLATLEPAARRLTPPLSSDSSLARPARDLSSGD